MAVAFSTGGSGYTRSDFMISDAAIPLRTEEAVHDQSEKFSSVLSGIGRPGTVSKTSSPDDSRQAEIVARFTNENGKIDYKAMAKAVIKGEIKLDDIPEDIMEFVLKELVELMKVDNFTDAEDDDEDKDVTAQAATEIASMFIQPAVQADDKTDELSQLKAAPVEDVTEIPVQEVPVQETPVQEASMQEIQAQEVPAQEVSVQEAPVQETQAQQEIPQESAAQEVTVQETAVEAAPVAAAEALQEAVPEAVQAVQPEPARTEQAAPRTQQPQEKQTEVQPEAEVKSVPADNAPKQESGFSSQQNSREEVPTRDVARFEVRTADKQPETEEAPVFVQHTAQRSRVVSKSDELDMIKSANAEKTDDSAAQTLAQPQGILNDKSVIFARADGSEVTVKPADVAQQVADRLIERTEGLEEGETEYSITLTPEDLGRITVKMTKTADGAVSVSIAAENSRTLRILEDNGTAIQDALKHNGVQLENWQTVSESQQETRSQDYQGSSKNPYREAEHDHQKDEDGESFAEIIASM